MVTIFSNIFDKRPYYISLDAALSRIKNGKSKKAISEIRSMMSKDRADKLKQYLPSVCFSGKFKERTDSGLIEHSGFIILDFDDLDDIVTKKENISLNPFVYACWVSPRGNGIKALVRIAEGSKHKEHFEALKEIFPDIDRSGINPSRVCYESWDPDIYINTDAIQFTKTKKTEYVEIKQKVDAYSEIFNNLLVWLTNRGDAFVTGERNLFIFKLASACCRYGIDSETAENLICNEFVTGESDFQRSEAERTIKSAYKSNSYGSAVFEKGKLIEKTTRNEIILKSDIIDINVKPKDTIFGDDVYDSYLTLYDNGYQKVNQLGIPTLDEHFKAKKGEITLLSGIGNYGKSSFLNWYLLCRAVVFGEKFAIFSPENYPPHEFYFELTEMLLGADLTPKNTKRPGREISSNAFKFISNHFFYVYPKEVSPTPQYIKEIFLELIIKEKVDGCVVDPFNQLSNDYNVVNGRDDKYLETFLSDCTKFAQLNDQYFFIVAHPKMMRKDPDGNYPCPDVFDLSGGAMWNNKMDNILIYHRPNHQKDPTDQTCTLTTKKIRRQKQVGIKGTVEFELLRQTRRFLFEGKDYLNVFVRDSGLDFVYKQLELEEAPF